MDSRAERGSANIEPYPPTAFLTQLVVRSLKQARGTTKTLENAARRWSREKIEHELALLVAHDELSDAFALAYAAVTFASLSKESHLTPQEKRLLSLAIDHVFTAQHEDGSWPRSRPLFHYGEVGNAYCFEYEMLTQLLQCSQLAEDVERHIPGLVLALKHAESTRYEFELADGVGAAWASGHHPQIRGPESWSTAAVYHFLHLFERLLSKVLRHQLFLRLNTNLPSRSVQPAKLTSFGSGMLDSAVYDGNTRLGLKKTIRERFLKQLQSERNEVQNGGSFSDKAKMSMLMFGPPGTSKTSLAKEISKIMGWPLLEVDPSHILIDGWDRVHATAIRLLDDLAELDCTVVLLDEFDELVRARGADKGEPISRFFTTAMLPKLIKLNKERRIVLLMATNFVDQFDDAITRQGRFDVVIQVMPPTAEEKIRKWPSIEALKHIDDLEFRKEIADLSYQEAERFQTEIDGVTDRADAAEKLNRFHVACNLMQEREPGRKWKEVCENQRSRTRI